MNFGIDDALKADKLMIAEPKRPYYDAKAAAAKRRVLCLPAGTVPQHIKTVAVGFGRNGIYLVQRPSDATMKRLEHAQHSQ